MHALGLFHVFFAKRFRDEASGPLTHVMHLFSLHLVTLLADCRAWKDNDERPFLLDTVFDLLCLIDYLCTRPDVDPERIGITGWQEGRRSKVQSGLLHTRMLLVPGSVLV